MVLEKPIFHLYKIRIVFTKHFLISNVNEYIGINIIEFLHPHNFMEHWISIANYI